MRGQRSLVAGLGTLLALGTLGDAWPQAATKTSVWELMPLGRHAAELPYAQFTEFACGTNGGPPSTPLSGWWHYGRCPLDAETGLREVSFRYDDEDAYWALANHMNPGVFGGTLVYSYPVVVSGLFSDDGILTGIRIVTDPRIDENTRRRAVTLQSFFVSHYASFTFVCEEIPPAVGETPAGAQFIKNRCTAEGDGRRITVSADYYRRAGQSAFDPRAAGLTPTEGQFWSESRFQDLLTADHAQGAELAARYGNWQPEPSATAAKARNCPACDFSGADLKRADLRGANLEGANLEGANLHGALLAGANLRSANLKGANLNKVDARRADFSGADLSEIMAYQAQFDGANAAGANFTGALMGHVEFLKGNLAGADLTQADMTEARLGGANLEGAILYNTWLHSARLQGANLARARLDTVVLYGAQLSGANFSGADLQRADLSEADLQGAKFAGADLRNASLTGTKLHEATFEGARLDGAKFPAGYEPRR